MRPRQEMEYSVIKESELENLIDDVNKAIKEGWRPQGGVSVGTFRDSDNTYKHYAQAMIR